MKSLLGADRPMELYESEALNKIPKLLLQTSEMAGVERRFLNGLLRYHQPTNVLEIGVLQGAGSLIALNAIYDNPNTYLTSIDVASNVIIDEALPVGWAAKVLYEPNAADSRWRLITGKDPVEIMDSLDTLFDFCIIDTAHLHPVESLNFLTALPYLADGAIVVLHDISAYTDFYTRHASKLENFFAPKLLFDSVVADKLFPTEMYLFSTTGITSPNIAAFQITGDTKKYILNVFSMLSFRWGGGVSFGHLGCFYDYFEKHYNKDCLYHYKRALRIYRLDQYIKSCWKRDINECKVVFYGAGGMCKILLEIFEENNCRLPYEIWDKKADRIESLKAVPVVMPDFDSLQDLDDNTIVIVTILDKEVSDSVRQEFQKTGFSNVYFWNEI